MELKGYRQVCDWCELAWVGGRVPEDQQVGHGKVCRECVEEVDRIGRAGTALGMPLQGHPRL